MPGRRLRLVVLVSGRGTNLRSLLAASRDGGMDADVVRVISNRPEVGALDRAREAGVDAVPIPSKGVARDVHEAQLVAAIDAAKPDLIVLAGYMKIFSHAFIKRYLGRMINIHPSLLPAFPGLDAQGQAHAAGVRIAGCTTHFVTEDVDAGPILMQAAVTIPPGASVDDVRDRILAAEHRIYPATIQLLATGGAHWAAGHVTFATSEGAPAAAAHAAPTDADIIASPEVGQ